MYVYTYVYIYIYIYIRVHVLYAYIYIYIYIKLSLALSMYIYIYIHVVTLVHHIIILSRVILSCCIVGPAGPPGSAPRPDAGPPLIINSDNINS